MNYPSSFTIFYIEKSYETPLSITSSTTFPASMSSIFIPSLSDSIVTPTPTVSQGILNTTNKM